MTALHITDPKIKSPHRFPIGRVRTIRGERCVLRSYSVAGHPIYSRPGGGTFVLLPKKRTVPKAQLYAPVKVKLPTQQISGIVVKRNPLRIRITDRSSDLYGCILEKPRYRAVRKE